MLQGLRKLLALSIYVLLLANCQQALTKVINEEANPFGSDSVLVDTRSAFLYTSSHIQGSVNLVTEDFLILKNPKIKKRIMDPDLEQTIERLSKKGLHPNKKIILLSETKNANDNKKWTWLLKQLGFDNLQVLTISEFKKAHPNQRFADPDRASPWPLPLSSEMQQELILNKGDDCFVSWSDKNCPY